MSELHICEKVSEIALYAKVCVYIQMLFELCVCIHVLDTFQANNVLFTCC